MSSFPSIIPASLFPSRNMAVLDLDRVMRGHELYEQYAERKIVPSLYEKIEVYRWCDQMIEKEFTSLLNYQERKGDKPLTVVVDGTGTNVRRQRRRMSMARDAGFHVVLVNVIVSFEKCLERNSGR